MITVCLPGGVLIRRDKGEGVNQEINCKIKIYLPAETCISCMFDPSSVLFKWILYILEFILLYILLIDLRNF